MAFGFVKKTWKDRISEYPTRRTLTKEDGSTELVTVSRSEGTVSQEGDAFSADNLNDLETRVDNALNEANSNLKLDYSNARADVQDLNTFLQKTLLLLFPKALCKYVVTSTGVTSTDYGCKIVTYDYSTNTTTEVIVSGPYGTVDSGWHDDNIRLFRLK